MLEQRKAGAHDAVISVYHNQYERAQRPHVVQSVCGAQDDMVDGRGASGLGGDDGREHVKVKADSVAFE